MTSPTPSPHRTYRAACPQCGAPVDFRSAASAYAVCAFCKSTLLRDGDALRRIGTSADLFDDHSPLQLGVTGVVEGEGFALVGRLQYRYAQGTWNEWHVLFDNGRSGWLSEDNGAHVMGFDLPLDEAVRDLAGLAVGRPLTLDGRRWQVASVTTARLIAAAGELPFRPTLDRDFSVADLRSVRGEEVGTLDDQDPARLHWSVGRPVRLAELRLVGLQQSADGGAGGGGPGVSQRTLTGRSLSCPNCGAPLEVKLATTQTIVCGQCRSVVALSQDGRDLAHYAQDNGSEPLIPLGTVGTLDLGRRGALAWQVVGYAERCEVPEDAEEEEQSFWREYLLYHRSEGFAFIVDAEDGWSWAMPITGAPEQKGSAVRHGGHVYRLRYQYWGQVTYVLGEFYWRVERGQMTRNADYLSGVRRLNREETGTNTAHHEVVWSVGEALSAETVRRAFRLPDKAARAFDRDVLPTAGGTLSFVWEHRQVLFVLSLILVAFLMARCSDDDRDCEPVRQHYGEASQEYRSCRDTHRSSSPRSGGGSWGGYSSGGSHK